MTVLEGLWGRHVFARYVGVPASVRQRGLLFQFVAGSALELSAQIACVAGAALCN